MNISSAIKLLAKNYYEMHVIPNAGASFHVDTVNQTNLKMLEVSCLKTRQ